MRLLHQRRALEKRLGLVRARSDSDTPKCSGSSPFCCTGCSADLLGRGLGPEHGQERELSDEEHDIHGTAHANVLAQRCP